MSDIKTWNRATVYESFVAFADGLPDDGARGRFYTGILKYSMLGVEPEFQEPILAAGFTLIRAIIDKSNTKRSQGEAGGKRTANKQQADRKRTVSEFKANGKPAPTPTPASAPASTPASTPVVSLSSEPDSVFSFKEFWDLYDKKVDRAKCEKLYAKVSETDRGTIKGKLPVYVASTPDVQFRKHPQTWLNGKCWNDEVPASGSAFAASNPIYGENERNEGANIF